MATDGGSQMARQPYQRCDVEACLAFDFVADFARALDHDDAFQSGPIVAFLQPSHIMDRRVGSGLDAAVIAVDRLMSADLSILESVGLLFGDENLDILAQCALIAFEREEVISLSVDDFLGDFALAALFFLMLQRPPRSTLFPYT